MPKGKKIVLLTGNANRPLAERVAAYLNQSIGLADISEFGDGEVRVKLQQNVRGCHVVVLQPTFQPDRHLMELKLMGQAARLASARYLTAVIPHFGYGRQDRKDQPRVPISAKLVAREIENACYHHVLVWEPHNDQVQACFDERTIIPDLLHASPMFIALLRELGIPNLVVGPPDAGRASEAQEYSLALGCPMFVAHKVKSGPLPERVQILGDVDGKNTVLVDDESSSGRTIALAATALVAAGALSVTVMLAHGKFVGDAPERIAASPIKMLYVSDSIPLRPEVVAALDGRIRQVTVAPVLAKAITSIHTDGSVTALFDPKRVAELYKRTSFFID